MLAETFGITPDRTEKIKEICRNFNMGRLNVNLHSLKHKHHVNGSYFLTSDCYVGFLIYNIQFEQFGEVGNNVPFCEFCDILKIKLSMENL